MLFDLKFFHRLKLLNLITRRYFRGEKVGHRKSPQRGASVEFAEYKAYHPGDDLRFIDWNLYARFDRLYIKKFHNEEALPVAVLVDHSRSMQYGNPSKFDHARKIAACIAYIALEHHDTTRLYTYSDRLHDESQGGERPGHIHRIMGFLEGRESSGRSGGFAAVIERFLAQNRRPGVVFILTDAMMPVDELVHGLRLLVHRRFEINLVHVLSPEELNPDLAGVVELIDSEDGSQVKMTMTKSVLTMYEEVLGQVIGEIKQAANQLGVHYHRSLTNTPFEASVLALFQAPGGAARATGSV